MDVNFPILFNYPAVYTRKRRYAFFNQENNNLIENSQYFLRLESFQDNVRVFYD